MKTILHYLNWALHDINHFLWNGLIKPSMKILLVGVVFFAVTLGPAFIPGMPLEVSSLWAFLVIIISPFVYISGRIYFERKNPVIPEPEIVIDSYTDQPIKMEPEATLDPLTVKQSMKQGLSWTIYMYGLLIGAVILTVIYDDVISWFSSL